MLAGGFFHRILAQVLAKFPLVILWVLSLGLIACSSYEWGQAKRALPGGFRKVTIPMFTNHSMESGIEAYFTSALIQQFQRSRVAEIVPREQADLMISGDIVTVSIRGESPTALTELSPFAPRGSVLNLQYRIVTEVRYRAIRLDSELIIWEEMLLNETTYQAPQVTIPGLNSVNSLYNLSARKINIESLAKTISLEAHNRITENF